MSDAGPAMSKQPRQPRLGRSRQHLFLDRSVAQCHRRDPEQLLPFADKQCLEAFAGFERGVYAGLDAGIGQKASGSVSVASPAGEGTD
jgi:hypothetical protein